MADKSRISSQEWEQIFQDFRGSQESRNRWLSHHTPTGLLEQAIQVATSRKDFPLRLQILAFLDENAALLLSSDEQPQEHQLLLEALRSTLQAPSSPSDGGLPGGFKEQMLVTVTSSIICSNAIDTSPASLESLVEMLLNFINRPNHSADRQLRATACECLRELEMAYPCLLHLAAGHLLVLCQGERTHASQSYTLLLTTILRNLATWMSKVRNGSGWYYHSILSTSVPLVPFSIPAFLQTSSSVSRIDSSSSIRDFSIDNVKEFRRAISFLLERPNLLTECGLSEFVADLVQIAERLELQPSLLKLQFWNLLHVYSSVSCHSLLTIFTKFPDAFEGEDQLAIYKRLVLFCREYAQPLPVRLLALHWLMGMEKIVVSRGRSSLLPQVARGLYPHVFDQLSLKAAKLECRAHCAAAVDGEEADGEASTASQLLSNGLVCISSYKWLPPNSMETRLLFHVLHRFLVAKVPHGKNFDAESCFTDSLLFKTLQQTLVEMARNVKVLAKTRILALADRFLGCQCHNSLGRRLLRTLSEDLVPSLPTSLQLPAYFPLMDRMAEDPKIPPSALIEKLNSYIKHRVAADSGNEDARLWLRCSEVLAICRTLLMHHQSSRIFHKLAALFGYLCRNSPDLEVRDSARFYLRMLVSVPGQRLRDILRYGGDRVEDSRTELLHVSSILSSPSPRAYGGVQQQGQFLSYILLERETQLLVRSSWSLVVHESFQPFVETFPEAAAQEKPEDESSTDNAIPRLTTGQQKVERVMDAKTAETLNTLRRHFAEITESGLKVRVICRLKLKPLPVIPSSPETSNSSNLQGIYAVVLSFSTTGSYGPVPPVRVPFLLSPPPQKEEQDPGEEKVDQDNPCFSELIKIELEPSQPAPALIDCHIVFSDEDAQTMEGQLDSIPVGIEDLFMKPPCPRDHQKDYLFTVFNALWYGCGGPGKLGTEIFLLKGGRQGVCIQGSESVKLLEAQADRVISAVENYLAEYVVSVTGRDLVGMARGSDSLKNTRWVEEDEEADAGHEQGVRNEEHTLVKQPEQSLVEVEMLEEKEADKGELGCFLILIFLPPRYHLLLRMEVSDWSTLVRIRTDYWPSLAHIDEFLESFMIPRTVL